MITPATMIANLADKATGWEPVTCSHEELIELVKNIFIKGQSAEYLDELKQVSKGSFLSGSIIMTPDECYQLYTESAASSKGRLVTIRDNEKKIVYKKDYLLLRKFAAAVEAECEKELRTPTVKSGERLAAKTNVREYCFCPQCGTKCGIDDMFCGECGTSLKE